MAVQAQVYRDNLGLPMCGLQEWVVNNPVPAIDAADLCFSFQDPQHLRHHRHQHPHQNMAAFDCNGGASSSASTSRSNFFSMALPQSLHAQFEFQRQEIDWILQIQSDRLRSALQEQRKQLVILLKGMELKALTLMSQKEDGLAQATKKAMELEACLKKAEMERESWQKLAIAKEAMVMDLSNKVEQVRERLVLVSNRAEDTESVFCGSPSCGEQELKEGSKRMACKSCNSRNPCIVILPCRHLCSCKQCEAFLVSCPVCKSAKEASMEIFWF